MPHPWLALPAWHGENIWYMYKFIKLQSFKISSTLYAVLHIPLVDKSLQSHLFRIQNIPLVHLTLEKSFQYNMQEEYLAIKADKKYISFPLSAGIMVWQGSNGHFCHINTPLYTADTSKVCSYTLFFQNTMRTNIFCTLSIFNQTQVKALNINEKFWAISTLESNKKLYITCLQFSYSLALWFPYDITYITDGCEANAITFILPCNKCLNVDSDIKAWENKFGLIRSYCKLKILTWCKP